LAVERTWTLSTTAHNTVLRDNSNKGTSSRLASIATSAVKSPASAQDAVQLTVSPAYPHYIMAFSSKDQTALVIHPQEQNIVARLNIGSEGASAVNWAANGDCIMVWSALHVSKGTFWYLQSRPIQPEANLSNPHHSFGCRFIA
jgi:hypothetical protein